jgi:hypothetical protein
MATQTYIEPILGKEDMVVSRQPTSHSHVFVA